jgi:hypothetical protein
MVGNVEDAQLSYSKWLEKRVDKCDFMVWHEFVCFTLRQESKTKKTQGHEPRNAEAISILCKSVQMPLVYSNVIVLKKDKKRKTNILNQSGGITMATI